jgi:hypothetical protein
MGLLHLDVTNTCAACGLAFAWRSVNAKPQAAAKQSTTGAGTGFHSNLSRIRGNPQDQGNKFADDPDFADWFKVAESNADEIPKQDRSRFRADYSTDAALG